mgnify:CR=1 FL=1
MREPAGNAAAAAAALHHEAHRLGDAGMGVQMAEYVVHAVLRYFRRFDQYEDQAAVGEWRQLPPRDAIAGEAPRGTSVMRGTVAAPAALKAPMRAGSP